MYYVKLNHFQDIVGPSNLYQCRSSVLIIIGGCDSLQDSHNFFTDCTLGKLVHFFTCQHSVSFPLKAIVTTEILIFLIHLDVNPFSESLCVCVCAYVHVCSNATQQEFIKKCLFFFAKKAHAFNESQSHVLHVVQY